MKLENLQILRGFSAILVCCFHATNTLNDDNYNYGDLLFGHGGIGVPVFFIISGFIMVLTTNNLTTNKYFNFRLFLIKRIIRIVPLYFILTIFYIQIKDTIPGFMNDGLIRFIKVFLFIPYEEAPPLYVGWTLNFEFFFYLLFSISLLFEKKRYVFLYAIILILVLGIPLMFNSEVVLNENKVNYFNNDYFNLATSPLLLQFLLGVLLGNLYEYVNIKKKHTLLFFIISIIIFIIYYFRLFSFIQSDLIICGLLVFSILLIDKNRFKVPNNKFLIYLGDISYSLYLIHPIIIYSLPIVFKYMDIYVNPKILFFLILILTFFSSMITYELIEKKLTIYLKKIIKI